MPFTMDDFHDLIRLIETRPEWRAELRSGDNADGGAGANE